jgi:outer membrane protein assembly factor BamA
VGAIRFQNMQSGPLPRDDAFLLQSLRTTVGAPFQPALVRVDGERLRRVMGDAGYPHVSLEPQPTRRGNQMDLLWQVTLGPQVRVGPVFVRGNFVTRPDTILQWVRLESGQVLTTTAAERSQRDLALIQLFNNASPLSFPGADSGEVVVPMLVEVEERHDHYGIIRVGGGASTEQLVPGSELPLGLLYASLGYDHRNLFGRGWTIAGQGNYGSSVARGTVSFSNPRFLSSLTRLETSVSYLRQTTVRLGDVRSGSGSIGFSR